MSSLEVVGASSAGGARVRLGVRGRASVTGLLLGASLSSGCLLGGCARTEAEEARRAEQARMLRAIELLRDAPNDQKKGRLERLSQESCSDPTICQLKQSCVEAYRDYVAGLDATAAARGSLAGDASAPDLERAAVLTVAAAERLKGAQQRVLACSERHGAVSRGANSP